MHVAASNASHAELNGVRTVEPEVLLRWLAGGRRILVLDVRESDEVEGGRGRLAGALHCPVHQLFVRRNEIPFADAETVVVVSNQGVRSREAAFTLSLLGIPDVVSLEGGLDAWVRKGFRLE